MSFTLSPYWQTTILKDHDERMLTKKEQKIQERVLHCALTASVNFQESSPWHTPPRVKRDRNRQNLPVLEKLQIHKGKTPIETQFLLEQKVEFVVKKLEAVGAGCRVEYVSNRANVVGSNGQKVRISII